MLTNRMWVGLVGIVFLLGVLAPSAHAIDLSKQVELSPFVGMFDFDDDLNRKPAPAVGARVGYFFTKAWSAEFSLESGRGDRENAGGQASVVEGHLDALYHFDFGLRVVPYLAAGVGGANYTGGGSENGFDPLLNYGCGLKYMINDWMAARFDVRQPVSFGTTHFNLLYTAGLSFFLGAPPPAVAVAVEPVRIALTKQSERVPEDVGTLVIPVELSRAADRRVEVPFTVAGSATRGASADYTVTESPLVIPAGATRGEIALRVIDDGEVEADETVVIRLLQPTNAELGKLASYTATIVDNDVPPAALPKQAAVLVPVPAAASLPAPLPTLLGWIERIHFEFDKYTLTPEARDILANNAEYLKDHPDLRIRVEGHCDERGTLEYNIVLGENRARSARQYLVDLKIDPDRMSFITYGEERPLVDEHNEAAWAKNRRAEFVVEE